MVIKTLTSEMRLTPEQLTMLAEAEETVLKTRACGRQASAGVEVRALNKGLQILRQTCRI